MIQLPKNINNRKILYLDIKNDLSELSIAELKNWVLFVIEDDEKNPILWPFAELCIDKDLLYMAAAGKACSMIDDLFDWAILNRHEKKGKLPYWYLSEEDVLMTSWHHDFDEGFWFVTSTASYQNWPIDTVLVVNLTSNNYLGTIQNLANKIEQGWLPP